MRIYFDLDGTLVDSRERLYRLFCDLVPECKLSFDEYWKLKKAEVRHDRILGDIFKYTNSDIEAFQVEWAKLVEADTYLAMDKIIPGVIETLKTLEKENDLAIITARRTVDNTYRQLKDLNILPFFSKVIVTEQKYTKVEYLQKEGEGTERFIIVGDTGGDIETGKFFNAITVGVLSGFLNYSSLSKYNPDYIFETVQEILNLNLT